MQTPDHHALTPEILSKAPIHWHFGPFRAARGRISGRSEARAHL